MLLGIPKELDYPILALMLLVITSIFIPKGKVRSLAWLSLTWGLLGTLILYIVISKIFNLGGWVNVGPFSFLGFPLWLLYAWVNAVMLFLYFLPGRKEWYVLPLYIICFAFSATSLDVFFTQAGLSRHIHWNPFFTFITSCLYYYGIAAHYKALYSDEPEGPEVSEK